MSAPADPLEASVRTKAKAAIAKSLSPELSELVEAKLAQAFSTGTSYKSAFRSLTTLLKPKSDALKHDTSIDAPIGGAKKGAVSSSEFENVAADLQSKKLSIGKLLNKIQEMERQKVKLLNEAESTASAAAPLAQQKLEEEYKRAEKARVVGLITQRIKAAKDAIANGGLESPTYWAEVGDASMELYYQSAPNTAYLNQAIKTYAKVESLSTEYLNSHPSFYLKRAAIHIIMENFQSAIEDLKSFAKKKPIAMPPTAIAAASVPVPASYEGLAAPRISAIAAYVSTVSKLVECKFHMKESDLRKLLREIPNPSREQMQREFTNIPLLKPGVNESKGLAVRVLGKVDRTSLYNLQKNTNSDGTPLPLLNVHESLETEFKTPQSFLVMDGDANCACLSVYNVMNDAKKQKPIKQNDMLVILSPLIVPVELEEGEKKGKYVSIQVQNPNSLYVNYKLWAEDDIVPVE